MSAPWRLTTGVPQGSPQFFFLIRLHSWQWFFTWFLLQLLSWQHSARPLLSSRWLSDLNLNLWMSELHFLLDDSTSPEAKFQQNRYSVHHKGCILKTWLGHHFCKCCHHAYIKNKKSRCFLRWGLLSHINSLSQTCWYLRFNIRGIHVVLTADATQILTQSLVISRLDWYSFLTDTSLMTTRPLLIRMQQHVVHTPKFTH